MGQQKCQSRFRDPPGTSRTPCMQRHGILHRANCSFMGTKLRELPLPKVLLTSPIPCLDMSYFFSSNLHSIHYSILALSGMSGCHFVFFYVRCWNSIDDLSIHAAAVLPWSTCRRHFQLRQGRTATMMKNGIKPWMHGCWTNKRCYGIDPMPRSIWPWLGDELQPHPLSRGVDEGSYSTIAWQVSISSQRHL